MRTRNQEFPNLALKIITFSSEFSKELYIQGAGATQESRNVINSSMNTLSASGVGVCDHTEIVHTLATGISRLCVPSLLHTISSLEPACSVSRDCSLTCWFSLSQEECSRKLHKSDAGGIREMSRCDPRRVGSVIMLLRLYI